MGQLRDDAISKWSAIWGWNTLFITSSGYEILLTDDCIFIHQNGQTFRMAWPK